MLSRGWESCGKCCFFKKNISRMEFGKYFTCTNKEAVFLFFNGLWSFTGGEARLFNPRIDKTKFSFVAFQWRKTHKFKRETGSDE
jgi:hypothetical protein